jgi:aspartyl protease
MRKIQRYAFLVVLPLAVAAADTPRPTLRRIKMDVVGGRPVVDDVFLDGHGPYRFLLDTGGQTNQVEAALAQRLAFDATFQVEMVTPAGPFLTPGGRVGHVSLGPAKADNQEFIFTSLDGIHALSPKIRGILGQEFLAHFDFTLDFRNQQLVFGEAPVSGTRVSVRWIQGRMAIPTNFGDLVLDSGSDTLTLFRTSSTRRWAQLRGSSGATASVSVTAAPLLLIGGRQFRPPIAVISSASFSSEGGLLPASLFQAIFICNSEGYVVIGQQMRR